jgi:hypothetical protein
MVGQKLLYHAATQLPALTVLPTRIPGYVISSLYVQPFASALEQVGYDNDDDDDDDAGLLAVGTAPSFEHRWCRSNAGGRMPTQRRHAQGWWCAGDACFTTTLHSSMVASLWLLLLRLAVAAGIRGSARRPPAGHLPVHPRGAADGQPGAQLPVAGYREVPTPHSSRCPASTASPAVPCSACLGRVSGREGAVCNHRRLQSARLARGCRRSRSLCR